MFEPVGPLPRDVYIRRRILVAVIAVVIIAAVIGVIVAGVRALRPGDTEPAGTTTTTQTSSATSTAATTTSETTASTTPSSEESVAQTSAQASDDIELRDIPPLADGTCDPRALTVSANSDKVTYTADEMPVFYLTVRNISTDGCETDLGEGQISYEVYNLETNARMWSNVDCFPSSATDVEELAPGEERTFEVRWSGTRSAPNACQPAQREHVDSGSYFLHSMLGGREGIVSQAHTFNIQ